MVDAVLKSDPFELDQIKNGDLIYENKGGLMKKLDDELVRDSAIVKETSTTSRRRQQTQQKRMTRRWQ